MLLLLLSTANQIYLLSWRVYADYDSYRLEVANDFFVLLAVALANVILVLEPVIDEPIEGADELVGGSDEVPTDIV